MDLSCNSEHFWLKYVRIELLHLPLSFSPGEIKLGLWGLFCAQSKESSPHISPVSRNMAPDRCRWVPGWTEGHSCSYGLKEDQAQRYMNKPEPG